MRIGELARKAGVSRDTIRFYEKNGLISSGQGSSQTNNYREYPDDAVLTLDLIQQAKAAGFTLEELNRFMDQLADIDGDGFDGEVFLQRKIDEVEANIERSKKFLITLKRTKQALADAPNV